MPGINILLHYLQRQVGTDSFVISPGFALAGTGKYSSDKGHQPLEK